MYGDRKKHYYLKNGMNVKDAIDEVIEHLKGSDAMDLGCALKYLLRCTKKGQFLSDIKKDIDFLKMIEERYENEKTKN